MQTTLYWLHIISHNKQEMQTRLNKLHDWCKPWKVLINTDKPKVMHFRTGRRKRTEFQFKVGNNVMKLTEKYKYLGTLSPKRTTFPQTYEKLCNACVVPILDYHSSVWGYRDDSVQNRSLRYFLGVHRFAPKLPINGDVS